MNYWDKYRDKRIVYQAGLRAAKCGTSGSFTVDEWRDLCKQHNNSCARCGATVLLTADHIIPLSQGGTNDIGNIQPLCRPCNSYKHSKMPEEMKGSSFVEPLALPLAEQLQAYTGHGRHRLLIDKEKARMLAVLTRHRRFALQHDITVDEMVECLIDEAWTELDQLLQET